jgi:hypothetical protein
MHYSIPTTAPIFLAALIVAAGCQPVSSTPSKEVLQQADEYIASWSGMGMYLPDAKQVTFFRKHLSGVQPKLTSALFAEEPEVRQCAAFVIDKIGALACACGPELLRRLKQEPDRLPRIYLINAIGSVGYDDPEAVDELTRRYKALSPVNVPRSRFAVDYDEVDERIDVAAALYQLIAPKHREEYLEFVTQWLHPPSEELSSRELAGYSERRWHAVIALEAMNGAEEAIPLLESMLEERNAPSWVNVHVPRVLKSLRTSDP